MRRAARRDANEASIVRDLRNAGAIVLPLNQRARPDLAVRFRGRWYLLEVKSDNGKLTDEQMQFAEWGIPVIRSFADAADEIGLDLG